MENIKVSVLLNKYLLWMKNGEIQYLKGKPGERKEIRKLVRKLIIEIKKAETRRKNLDWYEAHKVGRDLWCKLISCSLNNIDTDSKGNSKLFKFIEAATEFEDLLYGLEKYYRDHTLHSLWVYLIGEYILRECLSDVDIKNNLNWYLINNISNEEKKYITKFEKRVVGRSKKRENDICEALNKKRDAIWCIIALCHDLGYSLAKLKDLNRKVEKVLGFFDLPDFQRVGYSLDIDHQYHVTKFLELMAMEVWIVPSENIEPSENIDRDTYTDEDDEADEKVLVKCYRDDSTYWRLCQAFEKKKHGILSSYLIYKILDIFADSWLIGAGEDWGLDKEAAKDNIIRGDILYAIAQHDFDFAHLNQLSSLADILLISDELEEFSRFGRQLLTRKYQDTLANASINFIRTTPPEAKSIEVKIVYTVDRYLNKNDYKRYFVRKAERLCKIYSLGLEHKRDEGKYFRIESIEMTVQSNTYGIPTMVFKLNKAEAENEADLPSTKYKIDKKPEIKALKGKYPIFCIDDKIYVKHEDNQILLSDWLRIEDS